MSQVGASFQRLAYECLSKSFRMTEHQPGVSLADALTKGPRLVAVLAEIRDPGNAGTILRTADAAGAGAVVFAGAAVDPYNGKCVRSSAGSLFHVDVVRANAWDTARHFSIAGWYPRMLALPDRWRSWIPAGVLAGRRIVRAEATAGDRWFVLDDNPAATGTDIESARPGYDQIADAPVVLLTFTAHEWHDLAAKHGCV